MFHYSTALKNALRNFFTYYSSEISNKFSSFLPFIAASLHCLRFVNY